MVAVVNGLDIVPKLACEKVLENGLDCWLRADQTFVYISQLESSGLTPRTVRIGDLHLVLE